MRGYLLLIRKNSVIQMHSLAAFVKEEFPFTQDLSQEKLEDSYLCFQMALLHWVS